MRVRQEPSTLHPLLLDIIRHVLTMSPHHTLWHLLSLIDKQNRNNRFNDFTSGINPVLKAKFVLIHGALARMVTGEHQIAVHVFTECRIDVPSLAILSGSLSLESMTYITRCDSEIAPMESSRRPMRFTFRDSKGARRLFMVKQEIRPRAMALSTSSK
jgi:hypothetical protein